MDKVLFNGLIKRHSILANSEGTSVMAMVNTHITMAAVHTKATGKPISSMDSAMYLLISITTSGKVYGIVVA